MGIVKLGALSTFVLGPPRGCGLLAQLSALFFAQHRHAARTPFESAPASERRSALKGRRFESLEQQKEHLHWWNRKVARLRIHGTTQRQVWKRFVELERPALKPLPERCFRLFRCGFRVVSADGHVEVQRAFYSVPHRLLGVRVRVEWDQRMVRIYHREEPVAVHAKRSRFGSLCSTLQTQPGAFIRRKSLAGFDRPSPAAFQVATDR